MAESKRLNIKIPPYALRVMQRLIDAGEEVYLVGGSLRDALLGLSPNDYDMATSATPEKTAEIFKDFRTVATGLSHGTQTIISDGHPIEITTFRVDGSYLDSRHPESVSFTRSIAQDLSRRDFTVNAMAYSKDGKLIDLFGGQSDLLSKRIRAVGDAHTRFEEDALRIMRAFRFSAQLGFDIESDTLLAAADCKERLANISRERIGAELIRLICSDYPQAPLAQMKELGILPFVLGDFYPSDVNISRLCEMPKNDISRLGFLFAGGDEKVAREALAGLKCSNKQKSGALTVARGALRQVKTPRDAALLRADVGELAPFAARASALLGNSGKDALSLVEKSTSPVRISDLAIGGDELCALGISGREVGKMLSYLLSAVIDSPELNNPESLLSLVIKKQKEE